MSTLKVAALQGLSASSDAITLANDGTCTANITNNLSNRNKVINGAMICSQRATQVTGSTNAGYKTVDRFRISHTNLGTFTIDQDTNAPNGFSNSLKLSCTTADASPAASDQLVIQHRIEAQNLQDLAYGTSAAKKLVLSFYVKSNKTGNASVNVLQSDNSSKMVGFQYTISAANTWERKTISIPADTSGVINNDNGYGLQIEWFLNSGSNFTGGSHQATYTAMDNTNRNVSNLGIGGSTSDNFAITGVQLEVDQTGSGVATDFEHRSFAQELALCQRYFHIIKTGSGEDRYVGQLQVYASGHCHGKYFHFPVTMRATPTTTLSGTITPTNASGNFSTDFSSATFDRNTTDFVGSNNTSGSSGLSAGNTAAVGLRENSSISSSAEF
jgi:hypothetical protein